MDLRFGSSLDARRLCGVLARSRAAPFSGRVGVIRALRDSGPRRLGAHDIPQSDPKMSASDADRFPNLILRKQVIPVDDASVIANLGSVLGTRGVRFRITNADSTSLSDLRRQPVILVGALDNKWSLRISDQLPYRLERVFRPVRMALGAVQSSMPRIRTAVGK